MNENAARTALRESAQKCRIRWACFVLATAAIGAAGACVQSSRERAADVRSAAEAGGVFSCELDGYRYEFHAPSRTETLHDLRRDPRGLVNLLHEQPGVAAACRRAVARRAQVDELDDLGARYEESTKCLRQLGYL